MRPDMGKIAVDAYRYHNYGIKRFSKKHQKHRNSLDERPTKESTSRTKFGTKGLGENLAPLKRWLHKQVGRRWDDVYSEINSTLKGGYTNLEHIKTHVSHWVYARDIVFVNGWPHVPSFYGGGLYELRRHDLFLDEKGYLRSVPDGPSPSEILRKKKKAKGSRFRVVDDMMYLKHNGLWYKGRIEKIPLEKRLVLEPYRPGKEPIYVLKEVPARRRDAFVEKLRLREEKNANVGAWAAMYYKQPYEWHTHYIPVLFSMSKKEIRDFKKKFGELTEG